MIDVPMNLYRVVVFFEDTWCCLAQDLGSDGVESNEAGDVEDYDSFYRQVLEHEVTRSERLVLTMRQEAPSATIHCDYSLY